MKNPPLLVGSILVLALSILSLARETGPAQPDGAGRSGLFALLPLGRERLVPPPPMPPASRHPENAWLKMNEHGLDIIRRSEGLRLNSYHLAGQWLIGYGHAATAEEGMAISTDDADALLRADVHDAELAVRRLVKVRLNENEFSALVSLAYNMGPGAFARTQVLRRLNEGDREGAAAGFDNLVTATVNGRQVAFDSLRRRRAEERLLFLSRPVRA